MKLKNKYGFTLIELLAVIVVLAIIALIATPIVMNTIKRSKKGAAERSADSYVKQVEVAVAEERLSKNEVLEGEYQITSDGNLCRDKSASCSDDEKIKIEMSGTKPTSGKIKITNGSVDQSSSSMTIGDYTVSYNSTKKTYEATEKGNTTPATPQPTKTYTNGEVVYFNVDNGTKCSNYIETQSNTGVKSGCMKFYAFNDDGKDTVNLILDHNTTATVAWITKEDYITAGGEDLSNDGGACQYGKQCSKNKYGPLTLLTQLKNDTKSWVGTKTPSNYTMDQTVQTSNANYTIDYSSYKARLITAQEIAQITDNTTWDEKTANSDYYFDSKTKTESDTCKSGNTTGCQYGWLYDRTSTICTDHGCLNNADSSMTGVGYWTASSLADFSNSAWDVGFLMSSYDVGNSDYNGVRPVITISKSQLG